MTNFIRTVALKQHTPLIHFQHDQDGATLRATELRPKIDAWIIAQLTGIKNYRADPDKQAEVIQKLKMEHPEWLVGGGSAQHPALDYKLHIRAETAESYLVASNIAKRNREEYDALRVPYLSGAPYFADNEPIKNKQLDRAKRGVMYKNIEVEIFCLHPNLMTAIEKALPYVFAYHNFGVRQSKGFGCFSLKSQTVDDFERLLKEHPLYEKSLVYTLKSNKQANLRQIFSKIENEYKILKSGFDKDPSQMMVYFEEEKAIEWEKPLIKRELVKNKGAGQKNDYSSDDKRQYVRALLGVAELYEFPKDREKIKIACAEVDKEDGGTLVERFRSPITFKVFGNNIYMMPEEIPDEIYGRKFKFTNTREVSIILSTPKKGTFDLIDFLKNHVEETWNYV